MQVVAGSSDLANLFKPIGKQHSSMLHIILDGTPGSQSRASVAEMMSLEWSLPSSTTINMFYIHIYISIHVN